MLCEDEDHDCPNNENEEYPTCLRLSQAWSLEIHSLMHDDPVWTMAENEPNEYEDGGSPSLLW